MKILYITTIGRTMNFFKTLIKELIDEGNIVDIATNTSLADVPDFYKELNCKIYPISCQRTPFSFDNIKAIKEIKEIVNNNHYDFVHCHTPIVSLCTKLACKKYRRQGGKLVYTCHGFHFHKKSSFKDWILYYPAEKCSAHLCDMIITICKEDYNLTKKFNVKNIRYIHGVGIDYEKNRNIKIDINNFRKEIGVPNDAFLLTSIGELSVRKNFSVVIDAIHNIDDKNIYYVICGEGSQHEQLNKLIDKYNLKDRVILLGSKEHDFALELCSASDVGIIPSLIEGLGLAGLEHMAAGKPVIGSYVQGIKDYVINNETGILCDPNNAIDFSKAIIELKQNKELYEKLSKNASEKAKEFDYKISNMEMKNHYKDLLNEK